MRMNRSKLIAPAALVLAAAALAGCSSSGTTYHAYSSESGFGAGDRLGSYLFVTQTRQNIAAANQRSQPVELHGTTATATASVGEQSSD